MQENKMGDQPQELRKDLDSQILFIEFMLSGYPEHTGREMLGAISESLQKLKEITVKE